MQKKAYLKRKKTSWGLTTGLRRRQQPFSGNREEIVDLLPAKKGGKEAALGLVTVQLPEQPAVLGLIDIIGHHGEPKGVAEDNQGGKQGFRRGIVRKSVDEIPAENNRSHRQGLQVQRKATPAPQFADRHPHPHPAPSHSRHCF